MKQCILVTVNMGYGHQRASYPLLELADGRPLIFGEEEFVRGWSRLFWRLLQTSYNFFSRAGRIPVIGSTLLGFLERFEQFPSYYPVRDLSASTLQTRSLERMVKSQLGKKFYHAITTDSLPIVSSFYTSAMAAEQHTSQDVYCLLCDADFHRIWVPNDPTTSRICYLAPCLSARRRLLEYGVRPEKIHVTGFPLPLENTGGDDLSILRADLACRLARLDPDGEHAGLLRDIPSYTEQLLPPDRRRTDPVTVTYAVGGAGAQMELAHDILRGLKSLLQAGRVRLNLVAGIRRDVHRYFARVMKRTGLETCPAIRVIFRENLLDYIQDFNQALRTTDILWTKPSEMSFYCGLGIPFILSAPIGAQEEGNREWLLKTGAAVDQEETVYCGEWIMDMLEDGIFARAAMNGYTNAPKNGRENIIRLLRGEGRPVCRK